MNPHRDNMLLDLQEQLRLQRMIARISQLFLTETSYKRAFDNVCGILGETTEVSRVYIFENFDNNTRTCNTVEWCGKGIEPVKDHLQDVVYESVRYWQITLEKGELIRADDIRSLPDDVVEILEWQGIKSILVVPLTVMGKWHGFLGFDDCETNRTWNDEEVSILETAARLICSAMERRGLMMELAHASRLSAVGALSAGIAHEYNNLHAGIMGLIELSLENPNLPSATRRDQEKILGLVNRGVELTRKLLDLTRKTSGAFEPVDMHAVLGDVLTIVESKLKTERVHVNLRLDAEQCWVQGDRSELAQVLINVVLNAIEAMEKTSDRRVNIGLWNSADGKLAVSVEDSGPGIPERILPLILEPFFTTKGKLGGGEDESTGLGLTISSRAIARHKGRMTAKNAAAGGALLQIELPVLPSPPEPETREPSEPIRPPSRLSGRIGVLDDEEQILEVLQRFLTDSGHHAESFRSTPAAMEALTERRFDLFLVDLVMPPPDGIAFVKHVSSLPAGRRPMVLVMTGRSEKEVLEVIDPSCIAGILEKPFPNLRLLDANLQALLTELKREEA